MEQRLSSLEMKEEYLFSHNDPSVEAEIFQC